MAYDEGLAQRIREALTDQPNLVERKMFGGIGFMLRDNMCCGVMNDEMIARAGPDGRDAAMAKPQIHEFDFTGRSMKGMVLVPSQVLESDEVLEEWIGLAVRFALSLPAK